MGVRYRLEVIIDSDEKMEDLADAFTVWLQKTAAVNDADGWINLKESVNKRNFQPVKNFVVIKKNGVSNIFC